MKRTLAPLLMLVAALVYAACERVVELSPAPDSATPDAAGLLVDGPDPDAAPDGLPVDAAPTD